MWARTFGHAGRIRALLARMVLTSSLEDVTHGVVEVTLRASINGAGHELRCLHEHAARFNERGDGTVAFVVDREGRIIDP